MKKTKSNINDSTRAALIIDALRSIHMGPERAKLLKELIKLLCTE